MPTLYDVISMTFGTPGAQAQKRQQAKRQALEGLLNNPDIGGTPYPVKEGGLLTPTQVEAARGLLNAGYTEPVAGLLQQTAFPQASGSGEQFTLSPGQVRFDAMGRPIAEGPMQAIDQEKLDIRRKELEIAQSAEERQKSKMSAGLEKALLEAQNNIVSAQRNSNEYEFLANDFERLNMSGGLGATVSESFKRLLGTQDDVTEFRRKFNQVRLSEGLKNLPPGPATDRDVQEAFKGVPPENAPYQQVASFLRGAARLARFEAAYNQFKADYISSKSNSKGLNAEWRRSYNSPRLGRPVSVAEIYETAQNRRITPEEVKARLGIQ